MMRIQKPRELFSLIFFFTLVILSLSLISAGNLSLFPNPGLSEAGTLILYSFNFSNSTNCLASNIILNHTEVVTINSRGYGYVSINISGLSQVPVSLCEYKDGVLRKNHSFSDIIFNTIYAKNLNLSGDAIITGNINVTENITANYFIGNGSQLTGIITTETDPLWTANQSNYSTTAEILAFGYYNESDFVITDYFTKTDILGFGYYNSTDFNISDYFTSSEVLAFNYYNGSDFDIANYFTSAQILGFNYYNSSDFVISNYYTKTQIDNFNFYNLTDFDIDDYYTKTQVYNKTEVDGFSLSKWIDDLGDRGYTHLTNFTDNILWTTGFNTTGDTRWLTSYTETDPLWSGNFSNVVFTNKINVFGAYNQSFNVDTLFINADSGNVGIGISNPTTLLQILNDRWFSAKNYLGTGTVNMFKVNENDSIDVGATLNIGSFEFDEDSGLVTFVDMPVSSTPAAGTSESYVFKVDGDNIMIIYSEADGSGGVQNKRVGIGTITPKNTLNVIGDINFTGLIYGNGSQLTDISTSAISDIWVNESGDTMTGDLNMSLNKLTTIGELIMAGIIRSQNITPITTNLYSLGNSTNWFKELFVETIQSTDINTSNLNATNIKSSDIESNDVQSDRVNTTNFTIAGYRITENGGDLTIELT